MVAARRCSSVAGVPVPLNLETVRDAPKVLLHDHLDGGLRPATVLELADAIGYTGLPTPVADELGGWFLRRRRTPARWSATWRPSGTPSP